MAPVLPYAPVNSHRRPPWLAWIAILLALPAYAGAACASLGTDDFICHTFSHFVWNDVVLAAAAISGIGFLISLPALLIYRESLLPAVAVGLNIAAVPLALSFITA